MSAEPRRMICDRCGARVWMAADDDRVCGECGGTYRGMGPLEGLVDRWFAPPSQHVTELFPRHLKLIELMWTAHGRGRETYEALGLEKVSYTQFVTRTTPIVLRGLAEGWIEARIPLAPTEDDQAYQVVFNDPDRWAEELTTTFSGALPHTDQVRVDVEGDPDPA